MACGEKYSDLIRSASGRTPDSRCFLYCNAADADDWREGARRWLQPLEEAIAEVEGDPDRADDVTYARDVIGRIEALEEAPAVAMPETWHRMVVAAIEAQAAAACALERLEPSDGAGASKVPAGPKAPKAEGGSVFWRVAPWAALAGIGYLWLRGRGGR